MRYDTFEVLAMLWFIQCCEWREK